MDLVSLVKQMSLKNDEEPVNEANLKVVAKTINGYNTDVAFCEFSNQFFAVASQYGKAGCCMKVIKEQLETEIGTEIVYGVNPIFGNTDIEQETAARYIAEYLGIKKPLIIFVNLKNYDRETVKEIAATIKNLHTH